MKMLRTVRELEGELQDENDALEAIVRTAHGDLDPQEVEAVSEWFQVIPRRFDLDD